MNDGQLRQAYAGWLERRSAGREACVSPEALLALVEQRGSEAERLATLDHAMSCTACRHDLETLRAVVTAGVKDGVVPAVPRTFWSSPSFRMAAAVALVAFSSAVVYSLRREGPDVLRSGGAVVTVSPSGDVGAAEARTLRWRRYADAEGYLVQLMTVAGDSVYAAETPDTSWAVPATISLAGTNEYLWTVRVLGAEYAQTVSLPRRFRILR